MYREKVEKLQALSANFNIFSASPPVPFALIKNECVPPLPVMGNYLIWGFQILTEAAERGLKDLSCNSLEEDLEKGLLLSLMLENRTDGYSWEEKGRVLGLMRDIPVIQHIDEICSLVQSEGSFVPQTELFLKFPSELQQVLSGGLIDMKTAERVADLPETVFPAAEPLLRSMSFSTRRKFLVMLRETGKRDGFSAGDYTAFIDRLEQIENPFAELRRERYPRLSEMEDTFQRFEKKYIQGSGIQIKPPENFEGGSFTVEFDWKSGRQLSRVLKKLESLRENGNELFDLLF